MAFACFLLYCLNNSKKPKGGFDAFKEISLCIAQSNPSQKEEVIDELKQRITFIDV